MQRAEQGPALHLISPGFQANTDPNAKTRVHSSPSCALGMHTRRDVTCYWKANAWRAQRWKRRMPTWSDVKSQNLSSASTHSKRMVQPSSQCVLLCLAASTCCAVTPCSSIRPVPPEAAQPVHRSARQYYTLQFSVFLDPCTTYYIH